MPPSTVFSYWRRDHRRSIISPALPASSPSKGANGSPISSPPQLPEIPDTPTLTTSFGYPSQDAPSSIESPLDIDASKLTITSSAAPLSSSLTLAVPSPSYDRENRPHSSPGEWEGETFTSQANDSQVSVSGLRSDQGDGESNSKSNSPFRRSFGKQKRSPTAAPGSSHFRFRTSPDDSPADKQTVPQKDKDFRVEGGAALRRIGDRDRDVPVESTNAHHKSGKAMLHLLNPMSLLARRRSSQIVSSRAEEPRLNNRNVPAMPDDYDPRIRGNIVHDFSAPRPRRNVSAQQDGVISNLQEPSPSHIPKGGRWNDQTKRHSDHSPVFKEHFEDQNVLQVENKGYLQSSLLTNQSQIGYEKSVPAFARNLPSHLPEEINEPVEQPEQEAPEPPPSPPKADPPKESQYQGTADEDTIPNVPFNPSGLPRHLKSNASRFSFDMSGVESSVQEKLLEEKHKAKEAARKVEDGYFDDFDEDFDNDMLDDLDGLEEKIPGVNVDADDDDFDDLPLSRNINGELKSWAIAELSPVVASPVTSAPPGVTDNSGYVSSQYEATPTETHCAQPQSQEQPLPVASSIVPAANPQVPAASTQQPPTLDEDDLYFDDGEFGDLNNNDQDGGFDESIFDDETSHLYERKPVAPPAVNPQIPAANNQLPPILDEDDLYFDDGEFGDLNINDQDGGFDESIFDDVTSHLYERKPVAPPPAETTVPGDDSSLDKESTAADTGDQGLKHMPSVASDYRVTGSVKRGPLGEPIPNMGPARAHGGVLTEQNLDILHNALAFAANEAAHNSRLDRTVSMSERSQGQDSIAHTAQTVDTQPGLVSDDSRLSQGADAMAFEDVFDDDLIYDDTDDAYFDDAIVAAANAEALENDDEGFYGQEFGFYAQADSTCNSELTNGGYFGPRRVEGVSRSHSSRGKFQEPSLTPITERSEWSTRNSMISLKAHGTTSNPSQASPGLAQLVDMGNIDDELSLSALMKLRRGAWGGSNGSLRSSAGSPPPPHPISSPHRGSFTGASEASPIPFSPDEGPASAVGFCHDDCHSHPRTASPLALAGRPTDPPVSGITGPAVFAEDAEEVPISGTQRLNVL
ncbi:hypothetical protein PENARI_c028G08485 [Penicillium arizonense]|uniref:AGC-kinase C-terminal domain-containing protein n=1 Tax=Penicillium arizonense TaxID=1835702 RepID=A0A1F5L5K4_PENAI|nr:hypothetical protein PENARI_c028G08485 [Penicillium arizonense]OGE48482.1 hypothetical protein PENARI_c028G08485 [Penicillium arizonense]